MQNEYYAAISFLAIYGEYEYYSSRVTYYELIAVKYKPPILLKQGQQYSWLGDLYRKSNVPLQLVQAV